jgi:hypothetical protein
VDAALLDHDDQPPLGLPGTGQPDPGRDILQAQGEEGFGEPLDVGFQERVLDL